MIKNHNAEKAQAGTGLLAKAFLILDVFQPDKPVWTQADLGRATGMNRPAISRIVRYLDARGYLTQAASRGKYQLGPAAIDLGRRAQAGFDLVSLCHPMLLEIADKTGESVLLTEYNTAANNVVCVDQIESQHGGLRVFERIGATFPLHAGAAPKAVLAMVDPKIQTAYLALPMAAFTAHTVIDPKALRRDLKTTNTRGYALSEEETYEGVIGIGAGFVDHLGQPRGSIAVAGPRHRIDEKRSHEIGQLLKDAALKISQSICGGAST